MSERFFDDLARTLAQPMPRRRALRLAAGALAAAALPSLRPAGATAASRVTCRAGTTLCSQPKGVGFIEACCPDGETCCKARDGVACCHAGQRCSEIEVGGSLQPKCVGSCPPERSGCGLCCTPDQVCNKELKKCCPRSRDYRCLGPEPECRKAADEEVEDYEKNICARGRSAGKNIQKSFGSGANIGSMGEGAYASLGCFAFAEATLRPSRYGRCRQVADDALCPSGSTCDQGSGLCSVPDCGERATSSRASAENVVVAKGRTTGRATAAASRPGSDAVLREYRRVGPSLRRDAQRVGGALALPSGLGRTMALATALAAYRADVSKVEAAMRKLQRSNAGAAPSAALVLETLKATSAGLAAFESGVKARGPEAMRYGRAARQSFNAAERRAATARKALGCGAAC